ncbi:glycosyl transferase [Brachyspira sp. CAG:484]|nr:glycosyl transferase [Brachyspira sp. CAG:484]
MKPLVSVVTVTYNCINANRQDTLAQCIESVRCQSYDNIEHIIIDGASSDGTLDFLKSFEGLRIYSEPDSGVFDAFNKGILRASGKYIVFMNSDDYFSENNAVEISVSALENSGSDFSYGDTWLLHEDNPKKSGMRRPMIYKSFTKMPFCHQSMFCKTDVLKEIGMFDKENKIASDYEVYLKLLLGGYKGIRVNACIACFRCGGISGDRIKFIEEYCRVLKKSLDKFCSLSFSEAYDMVQYSSLPLPLIFKLSKYLNGKDKFIFLAVQFRHFIFQCRARKGQKMLKLFGFYFIKPEPLISLS